MSEETKMFARSLAVLAILILKYIVHCTVQFTVLYCTVYYSTVYCTVLYGILQYSKFCTVQFTVQYSLLTVQFIQLLDISTQRCGMQWRHLATISYYTS